LKKTIAIHHHLGLGDHFICNGLVRRLKEIHDSKVIIPVKLKNYTTVRAMYADDPLIVVMPFEFDADLEFPQSKEYKSADDVFRVGFEKTKITDWDGSFYDCVKLPYSVRWSHFKINRNKEMEEKLELALSVREPFVLVHKQSSEISFNLDIKTPHRIIEVQPYSDNMLDWCGMIEKANEIHCIDSSFMCLAQSIRDDGFFHSIRSTCKNQTPSQRVKSTWTILTGDVSAKSN